MNLREAALAGLLAAGLTVFSPLHAKDSGDCDVPIDLGNAPEMSDHSQLNAFIAAALEFKAKQREQDQHRKSCPELYLRPPTVWIDDPTVTQGPETLDSAVERSESFPGIDYSSTSEWYGRSTSESFSLSDLESSQLADSLVSTSLFFIGQDPSQAPDRSAFSDALLLLSSGLDPVDGRYSDELVAEQLLQSLFLTEQTSQEVLSTEIGEFVTIAVVPSFFGGFATFSDTTGDNEL